MIEVETTPEFRDQVIAVLNEIRPALQIDGGDVELIAVRGNDIEIRLSGPYIDGPATATLIKMGMERTLREQLPAFGKITANNCF
jgi:Fe-S cluster biogenesis protein NfuA